MIYYFQVIKTKNFGIEAKLRPDLIPELQTKMHEDTARYFAQKEAENGAEESQVSDTTNLKWDSNLAEYALEVCKHGTLCESSTPVEDFPKLQASDGLLNPHANYWWSYFSSEDSEEDKLVVAPTWAKSYALAILESGGTTYVAVVFSDLEGDGLQLLNDEETLRYPIEVYEDRTDFELRLANSEFRADQEGEYPFNLELLIEKRQGDLKPTSKLDSHYVKFTSLTPEIVEFNQAGQFRALQNGQAKVQVELLDASGVQAEPLMQKEFELKIELQSLETEAPTEVETTAESETIEETTTEADDAQSGGFRRSLLLPLMIVFIPLIRAGLIKVFKKLKEEDGEADE